MEKVSVIVPIYNVEQFIVRCAKSLLEQTLQDVEFIFVNDATPDNSMVLLSSIISNFPERAGHIRILEHSQNRGLPAARNTGLAIATGEYVFHFDSDDYADTNMLETLYSAAKDEDADIVWCDYYIAYPDSKRYMKQPAYSTPEDALKGMLCGRMKYNVWNKLVRRSLYADRQILFPEGFAMGEDMTMMKLFPFARKVCYIPQAFYYYVQWNSSSLSRDYSPKHLTSIQHNANDIMTFMKGLFGEKWNLELYSFQLLMKWQLLLTDKSDSYDLWNEWFPEATPYIWKDKNVSIRIRLVEWCAAKRIYWFLKLHYWVLLRFLYNIIYK